MPVPMTTDQATFDKYVNEMFFECRRQLEAKGPEYTVGSDDRLRNFRSNAEWNPRVDPIDVAGIYWDKHVMAIKSYIAFRKQGTESINGRIADCINYLLFLGMLFEEQEEKPMELPDTGRMVASS